MEQEKAKDEAEVAFLKVQPSYLDINQLTKLLVTSLKPKLSKLLASHDFASCLPTGLKELPSNITELSRDIKELKKHVVELKTLQWELPAKFLGLPSQISLVQENLKSLDSLPSLLHKVTDTLNIFATIIENASSKATDKGVPSAGYANASPAEREKNKNQAAKDVDNTNLNQQPTTTTLPTTSSFQAPLFPKNKGKEVMSLKMLKMKRLKIEEQKRIKESLKAELAKQEVEKVKSELVDLMGNDVVTQYYNKKLMYDKYCDKVLKRRKSSKITNCDVLTTKGPITLKVYMEDGTNEVISNLKVSDLHLVEWREVVQACPNKKKKDGRPYMD
ncbi:hypothetical protein Tco_0692929 [Tanacetum coccineum]